MSKARRARIAAASEATEPWREGKRRNAVRHMKRSADRELFLQKSKDVAASALHQRSMFLWEAGTDGGGVEREEEEERRDGCSYMH